MISNGTLESCASDHNSKLRLDFRQEQVRIVHTIDSAGLYGAEAVLLNLAREQYRLGHDPVIVSIASPGVESRPLEREAERLGISCQPFRMSNGLNLLGARRLARLAQTLRADVIHSHGYKSDILLAALTPIRTIPVVATLHGWTARRRLSKLGLYRALDQYCLRWLEGIVLVSPSMRTLPAISAIDQSRVHHIPNGVAPYGAATFEPPSQGFESLRARLQTIRSHGNIVLGAIGRLSPEKNLGLALTALRLLGEQWSRVHLVIIGDGDEGDFLRERARELGLADRVVIAGYIQNARQCLDLFDVLIMPSLTEGLPVTILEALSAGLPVVASAVGEIPTLLRDAGFLVPPGDASAFARAIENAVSNLSLSKTRALTGRARVLSEYGVDIMTARYLEVYRMAVRDFVRER